MNPYESDPSRIPANDPYSDIPAYGRYLPQSNDFRIDRTHIKSCTEESLRYWASVLDLCDETVRIYPADDDGRDVFALGSVIVKSSHLHNTSIQDKVDYTYADLNETQAIALARGVLDDIKIPEIYFHGKINGCSVIIQERIPGVALNVAWPYLSHTQKTSFKEQARRILRRLYAIKPATGQHQGGQHVVPDPEILTNDRINPLEKEILITTLGTDTDIGFVHNDLTMSNCIANNDKIIGIIDWEMAGFFGWHTAAEIHSRIRTPQRESFVTAKLSEETLRDMMFWNDLYQHEDAAGP
ncbi:kinase-like domain-containing protein [Astrocystis sublimbata]|nr:kinase-like domain-containing protein [Astrocystis sublimbata]